MSQLPKLSLDVLYQIILPIFLVLGSGFVVNRKLRLAVPVRTSIPDQPGTSTDGMRTLSALVFYILTPCLAFSSLATSDLSAGEAGRIGLFALVVTLLTGVMAWVLARLLRFSRSGTSSLLLVATFGNVGNYGLPLNELALGQEALDRAIIYVVLTSLLLFGPGVLVAARAQGSTPAQALRRLTRVPVIYALLLGGLVRVGVLPLLDPVFKATQLLGRGAPPLMLVILGMQLSNIQLRGNWRLIGLASGVRLLLAPLIAVALAAWMGLTGLTEQVSVLEASMPTAVFTIILAIEFNLDLDLATSVVFVTTVASPVTLIPLISYLRT